MHWLERINPQLHVVWQGTWPVGLGEPPRILFDHELVFFFSGICSVRIGGETRECRPGSYLLVPPGVVHETIPLQGAPRRACLHFDWEPVDAPSPEPLWLYPPDTPTDGAIRLAPAYVTPGAPFGMLPDPEGTRGLCQTLATLWNQGGAASRREARGVLLQILSGVFSEDNERTPSPDRETILAFEAQRVLEATDIGQHSVRAVLRSLGFSYEHLCRIFKKKFGITPLAYANRLRLEQAKQLLTDPSLNIADVARKTGFRDAAYFSRAFSHYTGLAPSRYAKR